MSWSTANHESFPPIEMAFPGVTSQPYLWGFLQSDGERSEGNYDGIRANIARAIERFPGHPTQGQRPRADLAPQRLRVWRALFERHGLISIEHGVLRLTAFGRVVRTLHEDLMNRIDGANDHLTRYGIAVLNRYTLRNPFDPGEYPADCDLFPYRTIWAAMRSLDGRLHWQELNRVLMHLEYRREIDGAIERIATVRRETGGEYTEENVVQLGDPAVDDGIQTTRRVTPWFSRASLGNMLIEEDGNGFRRLNPQRIALIDEVLAETPMVPDQAFADEEAYLRYLVEPVAGIARPRPQPADEPLIENLRNAVGRFGDRRIVCLSGLPGTGKTRVARLLADELADGDPYRVAEIQFHESTTYEDFVEGFVPKPAGDGFELKAKTLRDMNQRASRDPQSRTFVLLIEEFTRANVHSVLGELLTYVEHRDRNFRFVLSQDETSIARNLVILTTMNPRDRSAIILDAAIRRRLHVVNMEPSGEALRSMLEGRLDAPVLNRLATWYEQHLADLPFGHGIFDGASSEDDLRDIWRGTIVHLLADPLGNLAEQFRPAAEDYPWK